MADVLALPDRQCQLVTWMMREGECRLDAIAGFLAESPDTARRIVAGLVQRGFIVEATWDGGETYLTRVATRPRRGASRDLWHALDNPPEG